jgi:hypothetical protein
MTDKMLYFATPDNPFTGVWVEVTTTKEMSKKLRRYFQRNECYKIYGRVGFGNIPIDNFNCPILNLEVFTKLGDVFDDYDTDVIVSLIDNYELEKAVEIMSEWEFEGDCWEAEDYAKHYYWEITPQELEDFVDWDTIFHEQILFNEDIIWVNEHIWRK